MSLKLTPMKKAFVEVATAMYGPEAEVDRSMIAAAAEKAGIRTPTWVRDPKFGLKVRRGYWKLPKLDVNPMVAAVAANANTGVDLVSSKAPVLDTEENHTSFSTKSLIPSKDPLLVKFGFFKDALAIIESGLFMPVFITGLSGNGKTYMMGQVNAWARKEIVRVNITCETDEDDLIGGFRLVDGETVFFKGPAIRAMEMGCTLLLDEIDLGTPGKLMCLQSILEGEGYFIKKTGEFVKPAAGFNVVATANTKGQGNDNGKFIGTNVLNEAFLERFAIVLEHDYPPEDVERKILSKLFKSMAMDEKDPFINTMCQWATTIRKAYAEEAADEVISTRRLTHISKAYNVFGDDRKAVEMGVARFDEETKVSFMEIYDACKPSEEEENDDVVDDTTEFVGPINPEGEIDQSPF